MNPVSLPVDCLLLRAGLQALVQALGPDWQNSLCAAYPEASSFRFAHRPEQDLLYGYLRLPRRIELADDVWRTWQARLPALGLGGTAELHRLENRMDLSGASAADLPFFHYVVETDAEEGWQDEIESWYDTEHLQGLASVPGCVLAQRWINHDGGPYSLACYDLVSADVLGSPPWLVIRGTSWSDRTRPHFRNTRRTMFQQLVPQH